MKICKNCGSTNTNEATKCTSCSMTGMLVDSIEENQNKRDTIKQIFESCLNCGTIEIGEGNTCEKCNFPIPKRSNEEIKRFILTRKNKAS